MKLAHLYRGFFYVSCGYSDLQISVIDSQIRANYLRNIIGIGWNSVP